VTQPNYISPHFQKVHYPSSRIRDFRAAEGLGGGQVGEPVELVNVTKTEYLYRYQGQERQDELGLNWDSFKWRNYDYVIGRFMLIDPLAEKYVYNSPYAFSENRVIDARELEGLEAALIKVLTKYGKKGYDYVARTVKGDLKPISREQAVKKLQNQETVYSTGTAKDAKNLMKQSTNKKVVRHDGHDLPNGKKGMDHYQKKSGDGSHVNYGVDKSVAPVVVASTSEEGIAVETKTEEKSTMQKISDFASDTIDSIENLLGDFILSGGIPLLSPAPLGGGEQQWIEDKNKRDLEELLQQLQINKVKNEEP